MITYRVGLGVPGPALPPAPAPRPCRGLVPVWAAEVLFVFRLVLLVALLVPALLPAPPPSGAQVWTYMGGRR